MKNYFKEFKEDFIEALRELNRFFEPVKIIYNILFDDDFVCSDEEFV